MSDGPRGIYRIYAGRIYRIRQRNFDKVPTARKFLRGIYPYDECTSARCPPARRALPLSMHATATERDQISAYTLRAYTMPARDSYSKNERESLISPRCELRYADSSTVAVAPLPCNTRRGSALTNELKKTLQTRGRFRAAGA